MKEIKNLEMSLKNNCKIFCDLQNKILHSKGVDIVDFDQDIVVPRFRALMTETINFLNYLIKFYESALNTTISTIKKLSEKFVADSSNGLIANSIKTLFEIFYKILYQINVDYPYLSVGIISTNGHRDEMFRFSALMDRKKDILKKFQNTAKGIDFSSYIKTSDEQFTCTSIDGMNMLKYQIFRYFKYWKIKICKDDGELETTFELSLNDSYASLLNLVQRATRELTLKTGSSFASDTIVTIRNEKNKENVRNITLTTKVCYF
jgi:hypothetical protein